MTIFIFRGFNSGMNTYNVNFTANYIRPISIKKLVDNEYVPYPVSLVEISQEDLLTLKSLKRDWAVSYASNIYDDFEHIGNITKTNATNVYALTEQKNKFHFLDPQKVLGLVDISKYELSDFIEINYLQTNPKYMSYLHGASSFIERFFLSKFHKNTKYKNIGQSIVNEIHKEYPQKDILLVPDGSAINFYKKLGFKPHPNSNNIFLLKGENTK